MRWLLSLLLLIGSFFVSPIPVQASELMPVEATFFYTPFNPSALEALSTLEALKNKGIVVEDLSLMESQNVELLEVYRTNYFVPEDLTSFVFLFVGETYYTDLSEINNRLESNTLLTTAQTTLIPLKQVVYFHSSTCSFCQQLIETMAALPSRGVYVHSYEISENNNLVLFQQYQAAYFVPQEMRATPLLFVGDAFYQNVQEIKTLVASDEFLELATVPTRAPIEGDLIQIEGIVGVLSVFFAGFLDGFNPCAIAMLLLFISLLSFSQKKKVMIGISLTYIGSLFISYLSFGTFLYQFIHYLNLGSFITYVSYIMIVLGFLLFGLNLWDFFAAKDERFGDIKNQLPKVVKRFNKQIISFFTKQINEGGKLIYLLTFALGFIISLTEFMCTGQIYLFFIVSLVHFSSTFNEWNIFLLILYNVAFVAPLILIAVAAIKTQSIVGTSDKVRQNLHWIKLFNALLFLVIAVFFLLKLI